MALGVLSMQLLPHNHGQILTSQKFQTRNITLYLSYSQLDEKHLRKNIILGVQMIDWNVGFDRTKQQQNKSNNKKFTVSIISKKI